MMKKLLIPVLLIGLAGCNSQSVEPVVDTTYQWEKAYMDSDYKTQQELVYKKGSFTVDKDQQKEESGLKKDDVRYEVYYDEKLDQYYVLTTYTHPEHGNKIESEWVLREKDDQWKVDTEASRDISREGIQNEFEQTDCINCK